MNTKTLLLFVAVAAGSVMVYTLNIFGVKTFADNITSHIIAYFTQQTPAVLTGAATTAASVGGVAYKLVSSVKQKAQDAISQVKETAQTDISLANSEVSRVTEEKTALETQIEEYKEKIPDIESLQSTITQKDDQLKKAQNQIDALHELIPDIKNKVVTEVQVK